jgi:hypothetical protein
LPCDPSLIDTTGYFQFLSIDQVSGIGGRSNQSALTVIDGPCH